MLTAQQAREKAQAGIAPLVAYAARLGKLHTLVPIPDGVPYGAFVQQLRSLGYTVQRDGPTLARVSWEKPT